MKKKILDIVSVIIIIFSFLYIILLLVGIANEEPFMEYTLSLSIILGVFTAGAIYQIVKKE